MSLRFHRFITLLVCLSLLVNILCSAAPPVIARANDSKSSFAAPTRQSAITSPCDNGGNRLFLPIIERGATSSAAAAPGNTEMITATNPVSASNSAAISVLCGLILDANEADKGNTVPLVGATVTHLESGISVQTDKDGYFKLAEIPEGNQHFEFNGATATPVNVYGAYRSEKVIAPNTLNEITRPIYIMKIDKTGETHVNPDRTTIVQNPNLNAQLAIPAHTVKDGSGGDYTGPLSLSQVPAGFTPGSLPDTLVPGLVMTIQPMGLTFAQPVPVTFKNFDGLPEGTEVNLWSMDHQTSQFFIAGRGRVTANGEKIETISGGIRESSWHFPLPPAAGGGATSDNTQNKESNNDGQCIGSTVGMANGCMRTWLELPAYTSLGEAQRLTFVYSSDHAYPQPFISFNATLPVQAAIPAKGISYELLSFGDKSGGAATYIDTSEFNENLDEPFRGVIAVDASSLPTGVQPYKVRLTSHYEASNVSSDIVGHKIIVNAQTSPFGAGWGLAGLKQLHLGSDGSALLTDGNGSALNFRSAASIIPTITSLTLFSSDSSGSAIGAQIWNTWPRDIVWVLGVAPGTSSLPLINNTDPTSSAFTSVSIPISENKSFDLFGEPTFPFSTPGHHFGLNIFFDDASIPAISAIGQLGSSLLLPNSSPRSLGLIFNNTVTGSGSLSYTLSTGTRVTLSHLNIPGIVKGQNRVGAGEQFGPIGSDDGIVTIGLEFKGADANTFIAPDGEFSTLVRNADTTYTHRLKDGTEYHFNAAGLQTAIIDRNGNTTVYAYDAQNRLTTITDPTSQVTTFAYSGNQLQSITDPAGRVTSYEYDAAGNLTKATLPDSSIQSFGYDSRHLLTTETDRRGFTRTHIYDGYGHLTSVTLPGNISRTATYVQSVGLVDPASGLGTPDQPAAVTRPADAAGALIDGEGHKTIYKVGPVSYPSEITDPAGFVTTIERDNDGNPLLTKLPSGGIYEGSYDSQGNPLTFTDHTVNGTTKFAYEPIFNQVTSVTDPLGKVTAFQYDTNGNLIQAKTPLGRVINLTYGNHGLPVMLVDPLGTQTGFAYNGNGNLTQIVAGTGGDARTTSMLYTPQGYIQQLTDPLGRVSGYTYDAFGRTTGGTLPGNRAIAYGYDADGNLTSITPPGRPAHSFGYDELGQITAYTPPVVTGSGNNSTTYAYNKAQQLTGVVRPDGLTISYAYDSAGRLNTLAQPHGTSIFAYAPTTGQLQTVNTPDGVNLNYGYVGEFLTTVTWSGPVAGTVSYHYDSKSRIDSDAVGNSVINYAYDADDSLLQAGSLQFSYNQGSGLLTGSTLGSVTDAWSYNAFAEPLSYAASFGNTSLYQTTYGRDKLGRILTKNETIGGVATGYAYSYDDAGRLVDVKQNGATVESYTYDANGNRLTALGGIDAIYDDQDRLLTYGNTTYSYSANGELQSKASNGQTTTYNYDVMGNLMAATLPDGTQITYLVDGQDRRVGKKVNGTLVRGFLYQDQLAPIAELDASNNIISRFVYGSHINVPDYMVKLGVTYRLITDHLGSVRLVVNTQNGQIAQRMDYDTFGNVIQDTSPGFQPFGFAGGLYDIQTKLVRFGARDYDASVGRWAAKDPIGFDSGDTNLYGYVGNDPTNLLDPSGLLPGPFSPDHPDCQALLRKIENLINQIVKRERQLKEDAQGLPEHCPGDDKKPSQSREGHRRLIEEDKKNLKERLKQWGDMCGGPNVPEATPKELPDPLPIRIATLIIRRQPIGILFDFLFSSSPVW